jgi:hypothetical protein
VYLSTLGAAHVRAANWRDGIAALEQSFALSKGTNESYVGFFFAIAFFNVDQPDLAVAWYRRARKYMEENAPNNVELQRFRDEAAALLDAHLESE